MSLYYTKDLATTAFSTRSSQVRNRTNILKATSFMGSSTDRSFTNSFSQGNLTAKLTKLSDHM